MLTIFLQSGLFIWFICSLYFVATDNTLDYNLKFLGQLINILSLLFIMSNALCEQNGILYYSLGIILLAWYFYFTPQDIFNPGYTKLEQTCYVSIDIAFIVYLISSMTLTLSAEYLDKYSLINQIHQIKNLNFGIF